MRSHLRSAAFAVLTTAALAGVLASPVGAETTEETDPFGDVVDETGAAISFPSVDMTRVSIRNEIDEVVVTVQMGGPAAELDDPDWAAGEYDLDVWLVDPTEPNPFLALLWTVAFDGATPVGRILDFSGDVVCETAVANTPMPGGIYAFTADAACARKLPRTLAVQAEMSYDDGTRTAEDDAPDGNDLTDVAAAAANGGVVRLAGTDRILTAIQVSADDFAAGEADAVVLASAYGFPDALAGGPLAVASNAPMLLTATEALDARTLDEIERVLAPGGTVYLLGGTAALAPAVQTAVTSGGFTAQRVAGADRFETAVAIADAIGTHDAVLVADGRAFTDALIAGAAAPSQDGVVLLTDGTALPTATRDYLRGDATDQYAIGANAAAAVGSGIDSIVGANASELSVLVAEELTTVRGSIALASAASFPDSLAGGPHIARLGGALLLTAPTTLSPEAGDAIADQNGRLREVVVYGGTAAVSEAVEDGVVAAL